MAHYGNHEPPMHCLDNCSANSSTVPCSQTCQFCFVNRCFHFTIFKITETLISTANTENIKQLFGPEKLSGLRETGPTALIITFLSDFLTPSES